MKRQPGPVIQVIGSGEAFSPDQGNTSYLFKGRRFPTILFDCGYQVPERLWKEGLHSDLDAICLTHLHADHVFGVVPLLARYWEEKRKAPLRIFGCVGSESYLRKLITMGYPGLLARLGFELEFVELSAGRSVDYQGLRLSTARTKHSVENFTYRIDFKKAGVRSFAISGDGHITAETRELVWDVGLMLQEIYSVDPGVPVHMDLKTFAEWAVGSEIQEIGVAHHSRGEVSAVRARVRALNRTAGRGGRRWLSLRPGMVIPL